jgi:predicted hydrolase (HD superfamily)
MTQFHLRPWRTLYGSLLYNTNTNRKRRATMTEKIPTREEALALLQEYNKNDSLLKHAYAVEGVMRYVAKKRGEDEDKWGIIGLIHDLDYERFPDHHCTKTREILQEHNWPEEYIRAAVSHGWGICSDTEPLSVLEKTLFTIDELTGLVNASVLVRPSKSVMDLTVKSVKKKWKSPAFAAGVDRSIIEKGAGMLGVEVGELIEDTIRGMQEVAEAIGLKGEPD